MLRRRFIRRHIKKERILIAVTCISVLLSIIFSGANILDYYPSQNNTNNLISGNLISNKIVKPVNVEPVKKADMIDTAKSCSAVICVNKKMNEILCSLSYDECCSKYSGCRIVKCEEETCENEDSKEEVDENEDSQEVDEEKFIEDSETTDDACPYEYHDCRDGYEEIICKGDFESCSDSFDYCSCGTGGDAEVEETAVPDVDSSQAVDCPSSVFVCERQTFTMSGELAVSRVTCKSSFEECSLIYGNCRCGDSSLIDFPTEYVGAANAPTEEEDSTSSKQECEFRGRKVPCNMIQSDCSKSKNTCDKGNGIWITCKDKFSYCNKKYEGRCLCGVEIISSGFMVTEEN
jgi:hypothetical protein